MVFEDVLRMLGGAESARLKFGQAGGKRKRGFCWLFRSRFGRGRPCPPPLLLYTMRYTRRKER
jgi:hypothetical protein